MTGQDIPKSVGAYDIVEFIGHGGMASVYRARHRNASIRRRQGGDVAVKVMHVMYARDEAYRQRFEREAELGLELSHANIIKALDLVIDGQYLAIVMQLVQGRQLGRLITEQAGPMPWNKAWALFRQILDAVEHAHAHGVIHRDLKPANFIVTAEGRLYVGDFGVARRGDSDLTQVGMSVGTVNYMAPEQIYDAAHVDHRADIYALGTVFYAMLTGRLPWPNTDTDFKILTVKAQGNITSPVAFCADIPEHVAEAILQAMALRPDDRLQSVGALRRALEETEPWTPSPSDYAEILTPLEDLTQPCAPPASMPPGPPVPPPPTPPVVVSPGRSTPMPVAKPTPMPVAKPTPMPVAKPTPMPVVEPTPAPVAEPVPPAGRSGGRTLYLVAGLAILLIGAALGWQWWSGRTSTTVDIPQKSNDPVIPVAAPGASSATLDLIRARKTLYVGMDTGTVPGEGSPPMFFPKPTGEPDGFDYLVAARIAQTLDVPGVELVHGKYSELPDMLADPERVDVVIAGYIPYVAPGIAWSEPYLEFGLCLVVPRASSVKTVADLWGKAVGIYDDPAAAQEVSRFVKGYTELVRLEDGYWEAMLAGDFAGFVYDYPFARAEIDDFYVKNPAQRGSLRIAQYNLTDSTYAVAVRASDPELLVVVNQAIRAFRDSPDYAAAIQSYLGGSDVVEVAAEVTRTHTVAVGETLGIIAAAELGDPARWTELWSLNKDRFPNPHLIEPGDLVVLP